MKIAMGLSLLVVLVALTEAIPIAFAPGYGRPWGPGPVYGYGGWSPSSSFNRQETGASANDFDGGSYSAFANRDLSLGGGATREITSDKSGDNYYRGDDSRSHRLHQDQDRDDGNGVYSRNYDDNTASRDRVDNKDGYATSDGDLSYGFGRDRQLWNKGSNYIDNQDDRQRSRDTADDIYSNGPYGLRQSNYRNNAASRRRNHDKNNNAYDNGQNIWNFGEAQDRHNIGSSQRSHLGDGASSFNTDLNSLNDNGYGLNQRNYHNEGSGTDAADNRDDYRHNIQDGSRGYGQDQWRSALTSRARSQRENDNRHGLTDDVNYQNGPYGVSSSRAFRNDNSRNNIDARDGQQRLDSDSSFDWGRDNDQLHRQSDQSSAARDIGASSHNLGYNQGQDAYGQYSNNYNNLGASSLRDLNSGFKNRDDSSFSRDFGFDHGAQSLGDQGQNRQGSSRSSFDNLSGGNTYGV